MKKVYILSEISHPDLKTVSYLFGTMHSNDARAFTYYEQAKRYLRKCQQFLGEMDIVNADAQRLNNAFKFDDNLTLSASIGLKKYQKLKKIFKKAFDVNADHFDIFKPMFIQNLCVQQILSSDRPNSLDFTLFQDAIEFGIPIGGLETLEEQVAIAKNIPIELQISMLKKSLSNVHSFRKQVQQMVEYYRMGNIKEIYKSGKKGLKNIKPILLTNRNIIMAQRIDEICRTKSTFFAVGAAHLYGKNGVIQLLKERQFHLKPIGVNL